MKTRFFVNFEVFEKWIVKIRPFKCAQMEFGEDCVNELKKYKFLAKGDDVKSGFIIKKLKIFIPYNYKNSFFL